MTFLSHDGHLTLWVRQILHATEAYKKASEFTSQEQNKENELSQYFLLLLSLSLSFPFAHLF